MLWRSGPNLSDAQNSKTNSKKYLYLSLRSGQPKAKIKATQDESSSLSSQGQENKGSSTNKRDRDGKAETMKSVRGTKKQK